MHNPKALAGITPHDLARYDDEPESCNHLICHDLSLLYPTCLKLPGQDSNLDKENQNLLCYRYTTGYLTVTRCGELTRLCLRLTSHATMILHIAAKPIFGECIPLRATAANIPRSARFRAPAFPGHCQLHGNRSHKQNSQDRFQRVQTTPARAWGGGVCCNPQLTPTNLTQAL